MMTIRTDILDAFETIDAAIHTGDTFMHYEARILLSEHVKQWRKYIKRTNYYIEDGTLVNPDGSRSIFDDVDQ